MHNYNVKCSIDFYFILGQIFFWCKIDTEGEGGGGGSRKKEKLGET